MRKNNLHMRRISIFATLLLTTFCYARSQAAVDVRMEKILYENRPHILIRTRVADYYYDIRGGGFSRILDRQGKDWISFRMEPWNSYPASAASSYRGLPNLVFQGEADGAGHPGHDQCRSRTRANRVISSSLDGQWKWEWKFYDSYARLEVIRTDPDRSYWFLCEGTPGGTFHPETWYFGSDLGGPHPAAYDYYAGEVLSGHFHWMYAGNRDTPGTFFMIQEQEDELRDMIALLGNTEDGLESPDGMTVFGFGRGPDATPLLKGSQCFIIGFYPENITDRAGHRKLSRYIQQNILEQSGSL